MAVVTLTYNRLELTKETLRSFYQHLDVERPHHIVVDNGSTDGTVEWLRESGLVSEVFALPRNVGIGVGLSLGMQAAYLHSSKPEFVLSLENDFRTVAPFCAWAQAVLHRRVRARRILLWHPQRSLYTAGRPNKDVPGAEYTLQMSLVSFPPSLYRRDFVRAWFPVQSEHSSFRRGKVWAAAARQGSEFLEHIPGPPRPGQRSGSYGLGLNDQEMARQGLWVDQLHGET
jgi:glycosyltransferase involved in cell wall biosynthesis